jgi:uncharacterized membrane protein
MYYPSGFFKAKAREALKGHWQTALLIALIVNLPSLLAQGITVFTGNDPLDRLQAVIIVASRDGTLTRALLTREITDYLSSSGFWMTVGLNAAAFVVTPCLGLGLYKWLMDRLRKAPVADVVEGAFCRVRLFFRALGLQLLIILKVFLWVLPGLALFAGLTFAFYRADTVEAATGAARAVNALTLPLILVMAVPGAIAALRYAMAEFILADEPETKITECVRRSKEQMRELKRMLFTLLLSFLLLYLLQLFVASFLSGLSSIFSLLFQMLTGLAISVYMSASEASFYLETRLGKIPRHPQAEPPKEESEKDPEDLT